MSRLAAHALPAGVICMTMPAMYDVGCCQQCRCFASRPWHSLAVQHYNTHKVQATYNHRRPDQPAYR